MGTRIVNSIYLRPYQDECVKKIELLFDLVCPINCYCFVLPTGAGKSVIIGAAIKRLLEIYEVEDISILVCSWSRRIIKQDVDKTWLLMNSPCANGDCELSLYNNSKFASNV